VSPHNLVYKKIRYRGRQKSSSKGQKFSKEAKVLTFQKQGVLPFFDALYKMALLFFKNSLRVKNQVFASIQAYSKIVNNIFTQYMDDL
jgi:hypothetical protein